MVNMFCKNVLLDSQVLFQDTSAKNDTFRIFYAKLFIDVTKSFLGDIIIIKYGIFCILGSASFKPRKCRQVI